MKIKRKIISFTVVVLSKIIKKLEHLDSPMSDQPDSQPEPKVPEDLKKITKNIICNLTSEDPTVKSVALKGKWGVGKTHYIKKIIQTRSAIQEKKFIYVSLWGKKSIPDVEAELVSSVLKFLSDRKEARKHLAGLMKKIPYFGILAKSAIGFGEEIWREMTIKNLGEHHILCFDDFERLDKNLRNDFLGWMNHFTEHQKVKVLLVFNDEKLDKEQMQETGKTNHYREYFEKVVDIEYEYVPDKNSQVDIVFGEDEKYDAIKNYLKKEVALEGMTNIRIFHKIKLYWQKVFEILSLEFNSVQQGHWINDWLGDEVMTSVVYQCEELFNKDFSRDTEEQNILHQVRKLLASHAYYHDIAKLLKNGYLTDKENQKLIGNFGSRMGMIKTHRPDQIVFEFLRKVDNQKQVEMTRDQILSGFNHLSLYYFSVFLGHVLREPVGMKQYIQNYLRHPSIPGQSRYDCDTLIKEENAKNLHPLLRDELKSIKGPISSNMTIDKSVSCLIAQSHTSQDIRFLRLQVMDDFLSWLNYSIAMSQQDNGQNLISVRNKIAVLKGDPNIEVPKDVREKFAEALREMEKTAVTSR